MKNQDLMEVYNQFHSKGSSSWFSDGREERETIIKMGEPWKEKSVLEIGCGEGDLCLMMNGHGARLVIGVDYSEKAIAAAWKKVDISIERPGLFFHAGDYRGIPYKEPERGRDRLVMQGVLEHLDNPFNELQWMIERFKPKAVITSSPCFLNPRGIVWMTLHALGAVMSKTDLHFLHPWQFEEFCREHGYQLRHQACDWSWGNGPDMIEDLRQRIPLALNDGLLPYDTDRIEELLQFLERQPLSCYGATMVYRIEIP